MYDCASVTTLCTLPMFTYMVACTRCHRFMLCAREVLIIVEFIVALCCSLIFVRIFYLRSEILLCIGPY